MKRLMLGLSLGLSLCLSCPAFADNTDQTTTDTPTAADRRAPDGTGRDAHLTTPGAAPGSSAAESTARKAKRDRHPEKKRGANTAHPDQPDNPR